LKFLLKKTFSIQSDVWAFGITMYEIFYNGKKEPYYEIDDIRQAISFIKKGGTCSKPPNAPDEVYDLMMKTWAEEPNERPSFKQVLEDINVLIAKFTKKEGTKIF